MRTEIVRDWTALTRPGGEWNALLSSSHADTISLRWEWIRACGEVQGRSPHGAAEGTRCDDWS
jgi:hypothetical protein